MSDPQHLAELRNNLRKHIESAQKALKTPLTPEDIATIVRQVLEALEGSASPADLKFYSELEGLARYIRNARHEIASIKPKDISTDHIPRATDELDAVVSATEEATNKIMDVCDEISALAPSCPPEISEKLVACTTKVFEACNFQDITGQRITKVVETLKHIDAKISALLLAMGDEIKRGDGSRAPGELVDPEKALLNGPQLPKNATSQDEIDKLLSGN